MPTFSATKSLYYNDVNLLSRPGTTLMSRSEVPQEKWRIIVSPMDSIFGNDFSMFYDSYYGYLGILY